ncbi:uncharacterized protein GGS22DRAFT_197831 [Annulohypoxylon maeteangense]|uniref:uncharacterized protein n=1 Tax=Annulohypoxylon maeteangense TaxID=1927788 RepID=UPI00200795CE|nr:uncharacterized protein GGS22DRAFT_197831 [Annulohypoxylon maeteangense]KAI0887887.1 hypothetical protein GGS22DRAFT_197831 [Annulohypoxylon maeteangense]
MARIILGIQFGVMDTKVSWLMDENGTIKNELAQIKHWPVAYGGQTNRTRSMVPSRIFYNLDGNATWGYNIPQGAQAIEHLPLLLVDRHCTPPDREYLSFYDNGRRVCNTHDKKPHQAVCDFLGCVYKHSCDQLEVIFTPDELAKIPIHVVVTTQGGWNTRVGLMLCEILAASKISENRQAGKTTFSVIPEMCAIALGTFRGLSRLGTLNRNDLFTILSVDAATTNIITYQLADSPNPGMGLHILADKIEFSGPSILRDRFKALVKKKVGEKRFSSISAQGHDELMSAWSKNMRTPELNGPDATWVVRIETTPRACNKTITQGELQDIYNSIIPQLESLITSHVEEVRGRTNTHLKCLVVAGEFFTKDSIMAAVANAWKGMGTNVTNVILKAGTYPPTSENTPTWLGVSRCAALSGIVQNQLGHPAIFPPPNQRPIYMYPA